MSDKPEGVHASDILIGTFVILFGACFVLAGGACTIMWVSMMFPGGGGYGADGFAVVMLIVSLGCIAFGVFILYHGLRIARGRYRNG